MKLTIFISLLFFMTSTNIFAQDPHRFDSEITAFAELSAEDDGVVVFTGSSSIRLWEDLSDDCRDYQTVNTGFGGSHMSDLLYFLDQTVLRFEPSRVYIYEGDNDIAAQKEPEAILETAKQVADSILEVAPESSIHFISAKPSPSRWQLKEQYLTFNALLKAYTDSRPQLYFEDVWNPMLTDQGRPRSDIFVSDSLHMNRKGYLIWKDVMCGDSASK